MSDFCPCGHIHEMCHRINAARWCPESDAVTRTLDDKIQEQRSRIQELENDIAKQYLCHSEMRSDLEGKVKELEAEMLGFKVALQLCHEHYEQLWEEKEKGQRQIEKFKLVLNLAIVHLQELRMDTPEDEALRKELLKTIMEVNDLEVS